MIVSSFAIADAGLPKDRLLVSVHKDDQEAAKIWHEREGVPLDRIVYRSDESKHMEIVYAV